MKRNNANFIIVGGIVSVILFFILFRAVNRGIEDHITAEMKKIKSELRENERATESLEKEKKVRRVLLSDDLSPYMITPQRKSNLFKNQQYWDIETRKALVQPDMISGIQQGGVFQGNDRSPQQLQDQIKRIEERINVYKRKIRDDPNDGYARQKLQDLYMLKSTVRILNENVIADK